MKRNVNRRRTNGAWALWCFRHLCDKFTNALMTKFPLIVQIDAKMKVNLVRIT